MRDTIDYDALAARLTDPNESLYVALAKRTPAPRLPQKGERS